MDVLFDQLAKGSLTYRAFLVEEKKLAEIKSATIQAQINGLRAKFDTQQNDYTRRVVCIPEASDRIQRERYDLSTQIDNKIRALESEKRRTVEALYPSLGVQKSTFAQAIQKEPHCSQLVKRYAELLSKTDRS